MQAIREQREKASQSDSARAQQSNRADMPRPLFGNGPRVPQNLGDAQPFDFQPDMPDGDALQVAGSEGTPRNNQAQNRQFKAVVRALGLNKDQAQRLHRDTSRQGLGYHEMLELGQEKFGDGDD
ncbi:hypothetical protein [Paraburkholderia atlantica]|uniref:hypothetical protein n=1 Tax=Paraburkholderia atlantica TaxID=2654982 RepID=UPI001809F27D|nr:hypothetical protein [Paraburkholderia atlantica]MBB5507926.1 hypothetical protein [Paraburkholderia atlantica]